MKRAVIFYNGNLSDISRAKKYILDTDYIVCADGGTRHALKLGFLPDVIIGDFDSLSQSLQKKLAKHPIEWLRYKRDKDETDSELAVLHACQKGYKTILIFGLFGSRLDHLLTNILFLSNLVKKEVEVMIIEGKQEIRVTTDSLRLEGKVGDLVSLIPLKGDVRQVTTKGLQFKLTNQDLLFGYSFGLSDVLTHETAEINIKKGLLLVIHTRS